jgi:SAM-dependent methyltransferase
MANAPTAHLAPPPVPAAPKVPADLEVRWPAALLDAPPEVAAEAFARSLRGYARRLKSPEAQARFAMAADMPIYDAIDVTVVEAYGGVHPKHRLMKYHDFFVDRIHPVEHAIDLGCGIGMVAASIAERGGAKVTGVDWSPSNLAKAHEIAASRGLTDRITWVHADICETRIPGSFDAIVISNVLEHVTDRPARLRRWADWYAAKRILIRVPAFDRNWQTPLKQELGLDYRCDPTHETEYTEDQLRSEIAAAGMTVGDFISRWGEYWAEAVV